MLRKIPLLLSLFIPFISSPQIVPLFVVCPFICGSVDCISIGSCPPCLIANVVEGYQFYSKPFLFIPRGMFLRALCVTTRITDHCSHTSQNLMTYIPHIHLSPPPGTTPTRPPTFTSQCQSKSPCIALSELK